MNVLVSFPSFNKYAASFGKIKMNASIENVQVSPRKFSKLFALNKQLVYETNVGKKSINLGRHIISSCTVMFNDHSLYIINEKIV